MPSVKQITEKVLSGIDVAHYTGGLIILARLHTLMLVFLIEWVPRIVTYLEKAFCRNKTILQSLILNEPQINYEDLYYVAAQIYDSEFGEYDNPIVQPFIDKILPDIAPLFGGKGAK